MALAPILEVSWDQRGWFDPTLVQEGWWDQEYIPTVVAPPAGTTPFRTMMGIGE